MLANREFLWASRPLETCDIVPLGFGRCRASNALMFSTVRVSKLLAIASMQPAKHRLINDQLLTMLIMLSASYAANVSRIEMFKFALLNIDLKQIHKETNGLVLGAWCLGSNGSQSCLRDEWMSCRACSSHAEGNGHHHSFT